MATACVADWKIKKAAVKDRRWWKTSHKELLHLGLGVVGNGNLSGADVFNFNGGIALNVCGVVIECYGTLDGEFVFGEFAVIDPEFY